MHRGDGRGRPVSQERAGRTFIPATLRLAMARAAFERPRPRRGLGPRDPARGTLVHDRHGARAAGEARRASTSSSGRTWSASSTRGTRAEELAHAGARGRRAATRVASTSAPEGWDCYEIPMDPVDLSSTFIRDTRPWTATTSAIVLPAAVIPLYPERAKAKVGRNGSSSLRPDRAAVHGIVTVLEPAPRRRRDAATHRAALRGHRPSSPSTVPFVAALVVLGVAH